MAALLALVATAFPLPTGATRAAPPLVRRPPRLAHASLRAPPPSSSLLPHASASPRDSPPRAAAMSDAIAAARAGRAAAALPLATRALSAAVPDVRVCNRLLRELGDSGGTEEMMAFFEAMRAAGVEPTQVTYGTLVSRAAASREPALAAQCFRAMLRRGLQPDVQTFNSLINAFAKAGDANKAFIAADAMQKRGIAPTLVTFNTLIDACARSGNLTRAEATLARMRAAGLRPDERTYSILIHACARQAQLKEAFGWLYEMRAAGLAPNAVTWSALINVCCRSSRIERAFEVLAEMQATGFTPNVITYTTLIDGCAKAGQLQRALQVFRRMQGEGIAPNRITCHALFHGFLQQGEVLLAREVLQHMAKAGHRPGAVAFTALLTSASKLGPKAPHSAGVACLLRQMLAAEYPSAGDDKQLGGKTSSLLDRSLRLLDERKLEGWRAGEEARGGEQFDKTLGVVDALLLARVKPTHAMWERLFEHVGSRSQLEQALARCERSAVDAARLDCVSAARERVASDERAAVPSGRVHQPFLSDSDSPPKPELVRAFQACRPTLARSDDRQMAAACRRARQVFNEMRASGISPDRAAYNALINACSSAGDIARAEGAFGEMVAAGIKPDVISYTSLIKACAVAGDSAGADSIFLEMQQRTNHFTTFTPPSSYTFAHLMAVHRRAGNATRVFELLDSMKDQGLSPSIAHYSIALQVCEMQANDPISLIRALDVYESMKNDFIRLDTRSLLSLDRICKVHHRADLAARARQERSMQTRPSWQTDWRAAPQS
ncbi:hypothetical protein AB1Y20_021203 [Prymnesium parvum]|uniref:PROP1-like PPR domain-containing protein n=1 Tax=Prymnesium parvum TaxID=97485 RepID=A0AB34JLL6_PRYPA